MAVAIQTPLPFPTETGEPMSAHKETGADSSSQIPVLLPPRRKWTRQEFDRLAEAGIPAPEERLELIEGEIIPKMTQNSPHTTSLHLTLEELRAAFPTGFVVRGQSSLALSDSSQPEPDAAVVSGSIRDYAAHHPTTAILIVEISDTTLAYDRSIKAGLYARAGVVEYWIVNLNDRVLEAHRVPVPATDRPLGHYYASVVQYRETDVIAPLAAPDYSILVANLLP